MLLQKNMTVFALPDIIDGITEYCEEADYQILLVNLRLYKKFQDNYYRDNRHKEMYVRSSRSYWQSRSKELFMWLPMSA